MTDTRPLSERLAEIMRLPIPGGSADTLAEAVELARRVEAAPVVWCGTHRDGGHYADSGWRDAAHCALHVSGWGIADDQASVRTRRVALVEVGE